MTKLCDILDVDLLQKHIAEGVVRFATHPLYPNLRIYNYTEVAQFGRIWDNVTNVTRGLIVADDEVIARGFNKFHNLNTSGVDETLEANLPKTIPLVTEKLDGSMGIQYFWDDKLWVASRGSFMSEQAKWANNWIRNRQFIGNLLHYATVGNDHTILYEIIYKENRIVVDYDYEGLIITGCVDTETGHEVDRSVLEQIGKDCDIPVVKKFNKTLTECAAENNLNEEGYVLTYDKGDNAPPLKIKVKFLEYCRLHRILTGLNPKAIWEMLAAGQGEAVDLILDDPTMPSEFIKWFGSWVAQLRGQYIIMELQSAAVFYIKPEGTRKDIALYFQKTPNLCPILFAMLDGKDPAPIIWKLLKVKAADETFKKEDE
jgi:hypothetical protein